MFLRGQALLFATAVSVLAISADSFHAQTDGTCVPVSERAGREFGCFITAREELGALPAQPPLYWHLDTFPTVAAAQAAKGPRGTVVESLGRVWLFTIADAGYRPPGGTRVDRIGPLPLGTRGALRRRLHGGRVRAGHGDADPSAPWNGSVAHAGRIDVRGNTERTARSARG